MSIMMYGQPPPDPGLHPWPNVTLPQVGQVTIGRPSEPETDEAIKRRIEARIAWLERELSMHDAWAAELAILRRMLEARSYPSPAGSAATPPESEE